MSSKNVRRGTTQAKVNEEASAIFGLEAIVVPSVIGYWYGSWAIGGLMFFAMVLIMMIKPLFWIYSFGASAAWAFGAFLVAGAVGGPAAGLVFGALGFLISLGAHMQSRQHFEDATAD